MVGNVRFSTYSIFVTVLTVGLLAAGLVFTFQNISTFLILLAVTIMLFYAALLCAPVKIYADRERVTVKSVLKNHKIPMRQVESVELFQPTLGTYRLFASGGFMGYWGLFREGGIGKYAAYYGKASDCFLLRMKNGDNYVLGCENPSAMVDYINSLITTSDSGSSQDSTCLSERDSRRDIPG